MLHGVKRLAAWWRDANAWWTTLAISAFGALPRFIALGTPNAISFDETYYAKDAFSYLRFGYERAFVKDANERLLRGDLDVFAAGPEYVVHPPLGKWMIAIGEAIFGVNPFGWRFMMAVLGVAMIAMVHRTALRLTSSAGVAALAAFLFAIDGLAIVLSRTALLDQTLTFFVLATFSAVLVDRDHHRHTLLLREYGAAVALLRRLRPWRLLAILTITCAMSTKWSALWFALAFAGLSISWDLRTRRELESGFPLRTVLAELGWLLTAVLIGAAGYAASWLGWFRSTDAWDRQWAAGQPDSWVPDALRSFLHYTQGQLGFHVQLTSDHPYQAFPLWWPVQWRPTSFYYEDYLRGEHGCTVERCAVEVLALGNPLIWWLASGAVIGFLLRAILRRNTALDNAVVWPWFVGIAAGWLPWVYFHERTTFTFYSIVFAPFMCMLLAYVLERYSRDADGALERGRMRVAGIVLVLILLASLWFLPVWMGLQIDHSWWVKRMWLPSWL